MRIRDLAASKWINGRLAFGLCFLVGLGYFAVRPVVLLGDCLEYFVTIQAFYNHGTPEVTAQDLTALGRLLEAQGLMQASDIERTVPFPGPGAIVLVSSETGRNYTPHFWMYPLVALPIKVLLRLCRANELAALQVTNFVLLALCLYVTLFKWRSQSSKRWRFLLLAAVGPVLWYVPWPHPEVYTWASVCLALILLDTRRYGWAALAASMGALQNPGVAMLGALIVARAFVDRQARSRLTSLLGASLTLLAPLFAIFNFDDANMLHKVRAVDVHQISVSRVWSFLVDLNQGMLPYVPGLLALGAIAAVRAARTRSWLSLGLLTTALAMITVCGSTPNWNAGEAGIMRYAVWVVPVFAFLIAELPPPERHARWAIPAAVTVHGMVVLAGPSEHVQHNSLAAFVLRHAPRLYDPDPEVFVERQQGHELQGWTGMPNALPVAFALESGEVNKILLDACSFDRLTQRFHVEPSYLEQIRERYGKRLDLFYIHPPRGAVSLRPTSLIDHTSTVRIKSCVPVEAEFGQDGGFLQAMEARLPSSSIILEVPGKEIDPLQNSLTRLRPGTMLETLALAGITGICVDRHAYGDKGVEVEAGLRSVLNGDPPLLSATARWSFFDLTRFREQLKQRYSASEWQRRAELRRFPNTVHWDDGFYGPEFDTDKTMTFRWARSTASLYVQNPGSVARTAVFRANFVSADAKLARLRIESDLLTESLAISGEPITFLRQIRISPGRHRIRFTANGKPVQDGSRVLVWRMDDFILPDE